MGWSFILIFCSLLISPGVRLWADMDVPKARPIHLTAEIQPDQTVNLHWTDGSSVKPVGYLLYYAIGDEKKMSFIKERVFTGDSLRLKCAGDKNFRFKLRPALSLSPLKKGRGSNTAKVVFSEASQPTWEKGRVKVNGQEVTKGIFMYAAHSSQLGPAPKLGNAIEFQEPSSYTINLKKVPGQNAAVTIQSADGKKILRVWPFGSISSDLATLNWDGKDQDGKLLPNGAYMVMIAKEQGEKKANVAETFFVPWKTKKLMSPPSSPY